MHLCQAAFLNLPALILNQDDLLVDQHLDQFFQVEWIAVGALHNQITQTRRDALHLTQDFIYQALAVFSG